MTYVLCIDSVKIPVSNFSESLGSNGELSFSATSNGIKDLSDTTFKSLGAIQQEMSDKQLNLKIEDENENVLWESAEYVLNNASFGASESGVYFAAYFIQNVSENA